MRPGPWFPAGVVDPAHPAHPVCALAIFLGANRRVGHLKPALGQHLRHVWIPLASGKACTTPTETRHCFQRVQGPALRAALWFRFIQVDGVYGELLRAQKGLGIADMEGEYNLTIVKTQPMNARQQPPTLTLQRFSQRREVWIIGNSRQ